MQNLFGAIYARRRKTFFKNPLTCPDLGRIRLSIRLRPSHYGWVFTVPACLLDQGREVTPREARMRQRKAE